MGINPIVNNTDMNEAHRSIIVKILHQKGVCSRAEIAKITGLTQASITKIVSSLIDMGIVYESGIIKGNGNRRAIGLSLNTENNPVIGIKFSRHIYDVGVFDIGGRFYTQTETEFDITEDPRKVLDGIKAQVHAYLKEYKNTVAIGMAVPGPYLKDEGIIAIVSRMAAWHEINFLKEFENEFRIPFFIEQDANAGALAEWWFGGHEKPMDMLAYMLMGEGVGSGIIEEDRILGGKQGAASEIGHISIDVNGPRCQCGNYGCLELYSAAPVLLARAMQAEPRLFNKKGLKRIDEYNIIFREARKGNEKFRKLLREIAEYIAYGCVTLINAYNPDIIVIGDVLAKADELILPVIREKVRERVVEELYSQVKIVISKLTVDPTLYGAAAAATDRVLSNPSRFLNITQPSGN